MLFHTSKKVFLHVDCDSFFASCEVLKNPSLKGKFVCVGQEIIIACTYNCKKLGVKTGTPIWEARRILGKKGVFLGLDHAFYSEISDKLFDYLAKNTILIEPFSIDEAFCDITGLPEYFGITLQDFVLKIQREILENIGIPVSIGCSETRIKSKIFSKVNKPFGVYIGLDKDRELELFKKLEVSKIPFIGRKLTSKINSKAPTIYDFLKLGFWEIKKIIGKNGTDLWLELMGINAYIVRKNKEQKSISRSRSFNKNITNDKGFLFKQALTHFDRLFEEITEKNIEIKSISLFFRNKDFQVLYFEEKLSEHTNNRKILFEKLTNLFENHYNNYLLCRSVGVVFNDFRSYSPRQMSIFDENKKDNNYKLAKIVNAINDKYSDRKVVFGTALLKNNEYFKLGFRK